MSCHQIWLGNRNIGRNVHRERMDPMKSIKLIVVLLILGASGVGNAWADHGHVNFGIVIGPYWGPSYYPTSPYYYPPYYSGYYSPMVVERQAPPVYIEEQPTPMVAQPASTTPLAATPTNYWYYCAESKSYYPYVKKCRGAWQRISPQPSDQP